jgi:hypothetical protein
LEQLDSLAAISIGPPEVVDEIIAKRIIAAIRLGERDSARLLEAALISREADEISRFAPQLPLLRAAGRVRGCLAYRVWQSVATQWNYARLVRVFRGLHPCTKFRAIVGSVEKQPMSRPFFFIFPARSDHIIEGNNGERLG